MTTKLRTVLVAVLMVTSTFVGFIAITAPTGAQPGPAPVQNSTAGTVFTQLQLNGNPNNTVQVGLIKRGQSGGLLYNPSTSAVVPNQPNRGLQPGDVLVSRAGQRFLVNQQQTLEGSTGFVGPGATIFQGEEVTSATGFTTDTLTGLPNQGAEGQTLDLNQTIDVNQEPGVYADPAGNTLTVQQPRVGRLDILNSNGQTITEGGDIRQDELMIVRADVNYLEAERAEMNLIDPATGQELKEAIITREEAIRRASPEQANTIQNIVPPGSTNPVSTDVADRSLANPQTQVRGTIYTIVDMSVVTKAGDYTFEVQAEDDDPFRDLLKIPVRRQTQFQLVPEDNPILNFARPERTAIQGEFVDFSVDRSTIGEFHVVSIAADSLRRGGPEGQVSVNNVTRVFRSSGDSGVVRGVLLDDGAVILNDGRRFENGNLTGNVTAVVNGRDIREVFTLTEIDNDGTGTGQIDSAFLDDTNVNVNLFAGSPSARQAVENYEQADARRFVNQISLRVFQGGETLSVTNPGDTYVAGDDVDVEGTADPAIDFVSVYARSAGEDWQLISPSLSRVPVGSDGTWNRANVFLSEESEILQVPGQYRIGVIDSVDADINGDGEPEETLENAEFTRGASYQRGITVVDQDLTGGFQTFNGQVAVEDSTINASGTAAGAEEVLYVFVGSRGNNIVQRDAVDQEGEYRNRNVNLEDIDGPLQQGDTVSFVLSPARDGVFGGALETRTPAEFVSFIEDLEDQGLTQNQTVQRIRQASTEDDGSDDLELVQRWEFTRSATTVDTVVPESMADQTGIMQIQPGETMLIRGRTNLRSDDNTIVAEMREGPDAGMFEVVSATRWNSTGVWTATMPVPEDVRPGTYTLRVDDGDNIVTLEVQIVEQREQPTTTATPGNQTTTETPTETPTETTTTATDTTTTTTATETTTTEGTPGFTFVVTLLALLGVALLAARRYRN